MSLDVYLEVPSCAHCGRGKSTVYSANITHNLGAMADAAGIYYACWRPEERGWKTAADLIAPLELGLAWLKENRAEAEKHNAENGWGLYEHFVPWVESYLEACRKYPATQIEVSR